MRKSLWLCAFVLLAGSLYAQDRISDIKSLILSDNPNRSSLNDMTILKRLDMGIPGGDNWLVEWTEKRSSSSKMIFVYAINNGAVIKEFKITLNFDPSEHSDFDIMKDIPGTRIGSGSCVVNDYNGDGFYDIFNYAFGGNWFSIRIIGYDPQKKDMVDYAGIPFDIVNREYGPAPAEFIIYRGMKGFRVYCLNAEWAGAWGYDPPDYSRETWLFYAWDKVRREFVEIQEVWGDVGSPWPAAQEPEGWDYEVADEPSEEEQLEGSALPTAGDEAKNGIKSLFDIRILLYIGVVTVVVASVLLAARKKKA